MKKRKKQPRAEMPVRVLLDTCVWLDLAKEHKDQPLLGALEALVHQKRIELVVPRIVKDEFDRNKGRVAEEATRSLSSALKRAKEAMWKYGDPKKRKRAIDELSDMDHRLPQLGEAAVEGIGRIEKLFKTATLIETTDAVNLRAASRATNKQAPFHNGKNNFADAVVIEIYAEMAQGSRGRCALVTHNKRDFSLQSGNEKLPHGDLAGIFSKIKSRYFIKLVDALREVRPHEFAEAMYEEEFSFEPRRASEISDAVEELTLKVWYNRHKVREEAIADGRIKLVEKETFPVKDHNTRPIQRDIWEGALKSAKKVERQLGLENLGPWDDFEWGMINGKLSALRWVFGEDWDELYT
jgi:hypothetical protein